MLEIHIFRFSSMRYVDITERSKHWFVYIFGARCEIVHASAALQRNFILSMNKLVQAELKPQLGAKNNS